jgi:tol-pal system protein YbgF
VGELEAQNRSRVPAVPRGFAPQAPTAAPTPPALGSATTTSAADLYRVGVEKLQAKELDAAVLIFYDLVGTYPDHPLRENAQFFVADILYQQKDYRGALTELEALIRAVPRGEKVPDALLKIGLCQQSLGDAALARRTWLRLVRDYPSSVAARQARVLLKG